MSHPCEAKLEKALKALTETFFSWSRKIIAARTQTARRKMRKARDSSADFPVCLGERQGRRCESLSRLPLFWCRIRLQTFPPQRRNERNKTFFHKFLQFSIFFHIKSSALFRNSPPSLKHEMELQKCVCVLVCLLPLCAPSSRPPATG